MVEPMLPGMFGGALMRGALIRAEMGRYDEAIDIARRRLGRYGDANSIALLAGVYWQAGRHDERTIQVINRQIAWKGHKYQGTRLAVILA